MPVFHAACLSGAAAVTLMAGSPAFSKPPANPPAAKERLSVRLDHLDALFAPPGMEPARRVLPAQQSLPALKRPAWSPSLRPAMSISRDVLVDGRDASVSLTLGAARRIPPSDRHYGRSRLLAQSVGEDTRDKRRGVRGRSVQLRAKIPF